MSLLEFIEKRKRETKLHTCKVCKNETEYLTDDGVCDWCEDYSIALQIVESNSKEKTN
jgi:hypothetical protein